MKPRNYIRIAVRPTHIQNVLVLIFVLLSSVSLLAQDYYYYYNGEKQPLSLNTDYVYLVTSDDLADANKVKFLSASAKVEKHAMDNSIQIFKNVRKQAVGNTNYWSEVKLNGKFSGKQYLEYLKELEASDLVLNAAPYFSNKQEKKIGLSQYLYVKVKNESDVALLEKKAADLGALIVGQNRFMPEWYILKCTADSRFNALEIANKIYETGQFEHAEPDFLIDAEINSANDPLLPDQWGLDNTSQYGGIAGVDVKAFEAWDITKGSGEVIVAVLDHGFEMNHPDLQHNTVGTGFDTESGTSPALVLGAHGTACAGIVGAMQDNNEGISGVAPNVGLMSISNSLLGSPNSRMARADGINWAWQNGADVISNSWSSGVAYAVIDNAITNALTNGRGGLGTVIVFASGNNNGAVSYPANSNPDIVTVGAIGDCGKRIDPIGGSSCLSWNSTQGSNFGAQLDVMAPGASIVTTDQQGGSGYATGNYTTTFGGTSSACPMVAGIAGLILSVNPCLTHDQVEDILELTAQKVGSYAYGNVLGRPNGIWHNEMGYGLVDAEAAVLMAQQLIPGGANFDLYSKDRNSDTGIEPNPDSGPMYLSTDMWVRKNADGGLTHENPEFKLYSPNAIYVRVRNRSSVTSECANISVYFSKASTGLVWPTHWINYNLLGVLNGDMVNTVSIPPIAPGGTYIAEILWYPPNPADFTNDVHHFCLLSRIVSPSDPMFNEVNNVSVGFNVRNNNNIVWKNVSVYDNDADFMSVYIRGVRKGFSKIDLRFLDQGFDEKIETPFFKRGGAIVLQTEPELTRRIMQAELKNVKVLEKNSFYIAQNAVIQGLELNGEETFSMDFQFKVDLREGEETFLDVVQYNSEKGNIEGGERFTIVNKEGKESVRPVSEEDKGMIYPNPSKGQIFLKYDIGTDNTDVQISIHNITDSEEVMRLHTGGQSKGNYYTQYNIDKLERGIYLVKIKIGDKITTERLVVE
ncbi:S8 family serine peptidase [Fulvivirga maritima]|uniref:S8 family serine peptidase n=1 Tax=Fulvivirga maritima TaxID=2904247 RepID=UPI00272EA75A|nr:S8 family serine peptidase [Fulvivirga maritima]